MAKDTPAPVMFEDWIDARRPPALDTASMGGPPEAQPDDTIQPRRRPPPRRPSGSFSPRFRLTYDG